MRNDPNHLIQNPYRKKKAQDAYASLVDRIEELYGNEITNSEAHDTARNLLAFCQEMLNQKVLQKEIEKEQLHNSRPLQA